LQGEARASGDERMVMSTVLGSCVATCLYDPEARIGGMNHFLLAEPLETKGEAEFDRSYGLFLMELLINEMLKLGAVKSRLKARIYGGANMASGLGPIGTTNVAFARQFLRTEKIDTVFEDVEGKWARRIEFRPSAGLVRARRVLAEDTPALDKQHSLTTPTKRPTTGYPRGGKQAPVGDVELF